MITYNQAETTFTSLTADEQLALLWFIYKKIGKSVTPAAPDAASSDIAAGLCQDFEIKTHEEQLSEMRNIVNKGSTPITRKYGSLSANTKLAFWYYLAQGMEKGTIVPMPDNYQLSSKAQELLGNITLLKFQEQITLLRNVALNMGSEPAPGAKI